MKDFLGVMTSGLFGVAWAFAGPVTYILLVVDTWKGHSSIFIKIVMNLTLDAVLAAIWPITWIFWLVEHFQGGSTPIKTVLGF